MDSNCKKIKEIKNRIHSTPSVSVVKKYVHLCGACRGEARRAKTEKVDSFA